MWELQREDEDKLMHDRAAKEFSWGNSISIFWVYSVLKL